MVALVLLAIGLLFSLVMCRISTLSDKRMGYK